jgi:xanthosine utilization system XapX-like protein
MINLIAFIALLAVLGALVGSDIVYFVKNIGKRFSKCFKR